MNVNYASNTTPGTAPRTRTKKCTTPGGIVPQEPEYDDDSQEQKPKYKKRLPLLVAGTERDRRVIIIHEGLLQLRPMVYLAEQLYQAFLMFNQKLVLCECYGDNVTLQHCLMHLIHAWATALKVMFIHEDSFLYQWEASQVEVAEVTMKWLVAFTKINKTSPSPERTTRTYKPSDILAAADTVVDTTSSPLVTPNHNYNYKGNKSVVIMKSNNNNNNNSKRRYSSPMREATASQAELVSDDKPQSNETPRMPSISKKSKTDAATEQLSLHKADYLSFMPGQEVAAAVNSPVVVTGTAIGMPVVTATVNDVESWEPLDKDDYDSQMGDDIPSDILELLLPEYSALASGEHGGSVGGDDEDEDEEEEEDTASTSMADLLHCGYNSELEEGGAMTDSLVERPFFATEDDVEAFMNNQMTPFSLTAEDSSGDSADELLNT